MKIEVKLFAYFRDNRFKVKEITIDQDTKVQQVIENLGISTEEVGVTMINGRHCQFDDALKEKDSLGIFPMIGGG